MRQQLLFSRGRGNRQANSAAVPRPVELTPVRIGMTGDETWKLPNGDLHREDGPAETWGGPIPERQNFRWYQHNELHRLDGPAVLFANGQREWWREGILHRQDGPALYKEGEEQYGEWWIDGDHHRDDGPAVTRRGGQQEWYSHGLRHRDGGPALINPLENSEEWYQHGKLHREDGPAAIYPGKQEWWIAGTFIGENESDYRQYLLAQQIHATASPRSLNESLLRPRRQTARKAA